ncbi:MAG: hypothetical protein WDZ40_01820 [Candidatus Spechtbacterales bacterium]
MPENNFKQTKERARKIYDAKGKIFNPYLQTDVELTSDGFHHLRYSARRERNKKEQILKMNLLPLALKVIGKSGTLQEHRKTVEPIGKKSAKDGMRKTKEVEYWAFIAIASQNPEIKIKTILKRIGDGKVTFWSVMPYSKLKNNVKQKLYSGDMEND